MLGTDLDTVPMTNESDAKLIKKIVEKQRHEFEREKAKANKKNLPTD